jgi:DnaJ-domain-containing protein 1
VLKCPTWDHVESFYRRKVKEGGELSAKVPFQPEVGDTITMALELPDQLVIAIDAEVEQAVPASDGKKSAVRMRVIGLTGAVRRRLELLVFEARRERDEAAAAAARARPASSAPPASDAARARSASSASPPAATGETFPPPPHPVDAPVDELVAPPIRSSPDRVPADARRAYEALQADLQRMRDAPAHEVLGVRWDAAASEIRRAYFELTKRLHPDAFARYRSPAIKLLARDVFIHVNRAYDRMRDAAVASGRAIAAGPDLLPHRGWLAPFEDLGEVGGTEWVSQVQVQAPRVVPSATPWPTFSPASAPLTSDGLFEGMHQDADDSEADAALSVAEGGVEPAPPPPGRSGSDSGGLSWRAPTSSGPPRPVPEVMAEARTLIASRDWPRAKEILAESLRREPRNRGARALYHLASAEALLAEGKAVDARTQLEVALAHDPTLVEARAAMDRTRSESQRKAGILRRLFK